MSTKTLRKRIALVAVVALGAGVLGTSPATAANNGATGATNASAAAGVLNIATRQGPAAVTSVTAADQRSAGLLYNTTAQTNGLTQTATMMSSGSLVFYTIAAAAGDSDTIVVTGGKITGYSVLGSEAVDNGSTTIALAHDAAAGKLSVAVTPNAGATSVIVDHYINTTDALTADAATALAGAQAKIAGTSSKGTLTNKYIITVASASSAGVVSAGDSYVNLSTSTYSATGTDVTGAGVIANGSAGYISMDLRDAYGVSVNNLTAIVIEGTGGAGIFYDGGTTAGTPLNVVAVTNDSAGLITVARPAALAGKSFTTTVSIKSNGVTVATKSLRFEGEVAKIVVDSVYIARTGASNESAARIKYFDDKDNVLYPQSGTSVVSTTLNSTVTSATVGTAPNATTGVRGKITVVCAGSAGSYLSSGKATLQMSHLNTLSGTTIKSNTWSQPCAGDAYTYSVSLDKKVYTPGSVATATATFKDAAGNLANAYALISGATTDLITISTGGMLTSVNAPAATDYADDADGVKLYTFSVGTTEGDYNLIFKAPVVNTAYGADLSQTTGFSIKSASTAVTNADVLKAIVSLIASINKQIAALQKALLKK
jgi:hypothetical protein